MSSTDPKPESPAPAAQTASSAPVESPDLAQRLAGLAPEALTLLRSLSLLPELGFSFEGAQHAANVRPRKAATLSGLRESVYGAEEGAPSLSQHELQTLRSQLDAFHKIGLLQSQGDGWRMPSSVRQALGTFDRIEHSRALIEGYASWLEAHLGDPSAMLEEEAGWRKAMSLALEAQQRELFCWMATLTCGPGGWFHRRRELGTAQTLLDSGLTLHGYPDSYSPDPLLANLLFLRAGLCRLENKLEEAIGHLEASGRIADACKLPREVGMARGELGAIYMRQLRFDEAIPLFHEKMAAMQTAHDPAEFAATCGDLAEVLVIKGEHLEALDLLEQRLGLLQAMQDSRGAAMTRLTLGDVLADLQRFGDAVENYRLALPELEKSDPRNTAVALANLGIYQSQLGDRPGAIESFQKARRIFSQYRLASEVQMVDGYLHELLEHVH